MTVKEQAHEGGNIGARSRYAAPDAGRTAWRRRAIALAVLVTLCGISSLIAQSGLSPRSQASVHGTVLDEAGAAVSDASVRLEQAGASTLELRTNAQGAFVFDSVAPGRYVLTAEKAGRHSLAVTVEAGTAQARGSVTLMLAASGKGGPAASEAAGAMEFVDKPNFTIAAVTDWTAAGGHGSDVVLRASEALNREALTLKATAGETASAPDRHETESALRAAVTAAPDKFEVNRKLGEFYLRQRRFADAVPPLEAAHTAAPDDFQGEYDLAQALIGNGSREKARDHVQKLMARDGNGDVHRLAGELDEELGEPLAAVHEFERAVRMDPSEQNFFEWGSELLLHRAVWQAKDVFSTGVRAHPKSERMLTALGAALFAGALYDDAAQRLCEASDLNPADPEPYMFMGKIEMASPNPLACVEQKLAHFVELRPADPLANYFYAMTLWKQKGQSTDPARFARVQELLTKAVTIDPKCGEAYLQLGVLQATWHDFEKAIGFYTRAIEANPQMSEAHYRLGVAYDHVGEKEKATQEFQMHEQIEKQQAMAVEKQRREVKQFLVVVDPKAAGSNPN